MPVVPVIGHTSENNVCSMFFKELILNDIDCWMGRWLLRRRTQLANRWRWLQPFALGDSCEPMTLSGGVVGRLRAAVELAGSIKGLLIGEGG